MIYDRYNLLFLKLKSYFHSIILTRKSSDEVKKLVSLEKKLESAGIDPSGGSDAGRSEALSVFEIDSGTIL